MEEDKGRLFILHSGSLLATGLEGVLKEIGFEVAVIDLRSKALKEQAFQPGDIVLFDTSDAAVHPSLSLLQILLQNPEIMVIGLSPVENQIEIYHKQQKPMVKLEDFLKVLKTL